MYTIRDAQFDDEQMNGARCPRHGRKVCYCCFDCGKTIGHESWCNERDRSDDVQVGSINTAATTA